MKRRREIILDFTSLLDVIMIILFYFILYSHFDAMAAKKEMEDAKTAANSQMTDAEQREQEAERRIRQAEAAEQKALDAYNRLLTADQRSAQDYDAFKAFEEGRQLRLNLLSQNGTWVLSFAQGSYSNTAQIGEGLYEEFRTIMGMMGFTPDSTILCEFSYNGSARGSNLAYDAVSRVFDRLRKEYPYLYISQYDESKRRTMEHE